MTYRDNNRNDGVILAIGTLSEPGSDKVPTNTNLHWNRGVGGGNELVKIITRKRDITKIFSLSNEYAIDILHNISYNYMYKKEVQLWWL